jgi:hypothetical protein
MRRSLFARKPISLLLEEMNGEHRLRRVLGPVSLTSLGVGFGVYFGYGRHHSVMSQRLADQATALPARAADS